MELTQDKLRICLRVAFASATGLLISKLLNWNFGVFFTVYPMLLLGMIPVLNRFIALQFVASSLLTSLEIMILPSLLHHWPPAFTVVVFCLFLGRFLLMAKGPLMLFGASGCVSLSIMLHFSSYEHFSLTDMATMNITASVLSVALAYIGYAFLPNKEPLVMRAAPAKSNNVIRHQALLGAIVATLSFTVFQSVDLVDSLSAQVATVLILFPMSFMGAVESGRMRCIGTLLGCALGLLTQVFLYSHYHNLVLLSLSFWLCAMVFARWHVKEGVSGIGFAGLTTTGILFGQYISPEHDLVYSALYRMSSMTLAILVTLCCVYLVHKFLNLFPSTRYVIMPSGQP
ncbi:1,4-alpha-glucan branching protein [Oceanisphaera profunda]|uniref:1,4-alpha-glucan branching protein n=1 Tax=Oceanisphaera profunda TaxID=1416627 RepID=A0A1Y0D4U7_9GAMM|nr:DUF2955 domain-containing protein [Oceanisphaera profunda]ART82561.1 1,4-alpha-glucan branching protein [Oceanisphaera profunda]